MPAPIKKEDFPQYFKTKSCLLAFVDKDKMYKIQAIGSNTNDGVTIDYYTTRNMVLKHYPVPGSAEELTEEQIKNLLQSLFNRYISKIIGKGW